MEGLSVASTVRETRRGGLMSVRAMTPILICYDGSAGARRAIETAGGLFPGRRAIVLHAWSPMAILGASYLGTLAMLGYDDEVGAGRTPRRSPRRVATWQRRPVSKRSTRDHRGHPRRRPACDPRHREPVRGRVDRARGARALDHEVVMLGSVSTASAATCSTFPSTDRAAARAPRHRAGAEPSSGRQRRHETPHVGDARATAPPPTRAAGRCSSAT